MFVTLTKLHTKNGVGLLVENIFLLDFFIINFGLLTEDWPPDLNVCMQMVDMTLSISGPQIVIPLTWSSNNIMRHIGNVYFAICSNISNDITSNWINWMLYWNTKHIVHDIGQSNSMLLKSETALLATISQSHLFILVTISQLNNLTSCFKYFSWNWP